MAQCSPPAVASPQNSEDAIISIHSPLGFALPNPPDPRNPRFERQKEMPDVDLEIVIRHCRCAAAKTELCVTVVFFEALVSFDSKGFTAYPWMIN
jgi:hypothetical protein